MLVVLLIQSAALVGFVAGWFAFALGLKCLLGNGGFSRSSMLNLLEKWKTPSGKHWRDELR